MIVAAKLGTVGEAQPMDHAGLQVGDEQLPVPAIDRDVAERRAGIGPTAEAHLCERLRPIAVRRRELPDRARPAAAAPHARHPAAIVRAAVEAERRRRRQIDVRRGGRVEGDAEHLADLAGRHRQALRRIAPHGPAWRRPRRAKIHDAADGAVHVDDGSAVLGGSPRKARDIGLAGRDQVLSDGRRGESRAQRPPGQSEHRKETADTRTCRAAARRGSPDDGARLGHSALPSTAERK
ncbi:MAG: hypothetical protein M5U07_16010 [Xanthobacteraceae bacterium]|nr:hypothetical protein [Xanthobacteraceae bacterium]